MNKSTFNIHYFQLFPYCNMQFKGVKGDIFKKYYNMIRRYDIGGVLRDGGHQWGPYTFDATRQWRANLIKLDANMLF